MLQMLNTFCNFATKIYLKINSYCTSMTNIKNVLITPNHSLPGTSQGHDSKQESEGKTEGYLGDP